jgi:hypothetical protein
MIHAPEGVVRPLALKVQGRTRCAELPIQWRLRRKPRGPYDSHDHVTNDAPDLQQLVSAWCRSGTRGVG